MFIDGGTGPGCSKYSCHKPGAVAETGYYSGEVTGYQQNLEDWSSSGSFSHHTAHNNELLSFLKKANYSNA